METIKDKLQRFYNPISGQQYKGGGPNTRYKSWEWCHEAFLQGKADYDAAKTQKDKDEIKDYLCLHLAFYLASWGMYRGSAFLLQRDYLAHHAAVTDILEFDDNGLLWDYDPKNTCDIARAYDLLFKNPYFVKRKSRKEAASNSENIDLKEMGIYWQVKHAYISQGYGGKQATDDEPSDTLVTKILMGTFACIPAFDRFLKDGIERYIGSKLGNFSKGAKTYKINNNYTLSAKIESGKTIEKYQGGESFKALAAFAVDNQSELKNIQNGVKIIQRAGNSGKPYPIMKLVDMYFWEIGYEMDMAKTLNNNNTSIKKIKKLLKKADDMNLHTRSGAYHNNPNNQGVCVKEAEDAAKDIESRNN